MNRRNFITTTSLALAGTGLSFNSMAWGKPRNKVGLQLYSLRDIINANPKGVLEMVAAAGYKELETYGHADGKLFGLPVSEYGAMVKGLGMKTISGHYDIKAVENGWEQICDQAKSIGQKYVVVPWLDKKNYATLDALKATCETLNKGGEVAKKYNLRMGYHNHAFEFQKVEGQIMLDFMIAQLDPKLVGIELDLYWVVNAGFDPLDYFAKYPGRFEQWHVKDMDKTDRNKNADIGTGTIDFKKIFAAAKQSGMQHYFIEQETYPINSTESVKASIKNLLSIL